MIQVLTFLFKDYLNKPIEDFSGRLISAFGILEVIGKDITKEGINRLRYIEKYTHKDILVSFYKLDRVINPSKGEFRVVEKKFEFTKDMPDSNEYNKETINLSEGKIQNYLCMAINEVHKVVVKYIAPYMIEQQINDSTDQNQNNILDQIKF